MIQATLIPAALASLVFSGSSEPALGVPSAGFEPAQKKRGDYVAKFSAPELFIQGEPYRVTVDVVGVGETSSEMPAWLLTPAAWLVDNKPLTRREAEGSIGIDPGQQISLSIDIAPRILERFDGDPVDFRVAFAESGVDPVDVIYLALPERGINFEELPKEQLGNYQVVLQTTGGPIWLEMWPDVAPNHVRNFLDLSSKGFYDGSPFYRIIPAFMIQGGRAASGEAAPRKLDAEFNSRSHRAGVLSAARLPNDINSATSEFFIVHKNQPGLDGDYSGFGRVIMGMDAVDNIVDGVEVQYQLKNRLLSKGVKMDTGNVFFDIELNRPNPPQVISQALVVKATKSRPTEKPEEK